MTIQEIKQELETRGIKKTAFARLVGISSAMLSQYFSGYRKASDEKIISMMIMLNDYYPKRKTK